MLKSISSEEEIGQATTATPPSQRSANSGGGLSHSSSGGQLPLAHTSLSVIGSRDSNLDSLGTTTPSIAYANGTTVLRNIPAIRSNSSSSSLFPNANTNNTTNIANKEDRKERRISGVSHIQTIMSSKASWWFRLSWVVLTLVGHNSGCLSLLLRHRSLCARFLTLRMLAQIVQLN